MENQILYFIKNIINYIHSQYLHYIMNIINFILLYNPINHSFGKLNTIIINYN